MSRIALIKQLTLCFVFMLAAVLVQSTQHVEAGEFDFFVLEASGDVKDYQVVAGALNYVGGINIGGYLPISNPRALAFVRDMGYQGNPQRLCAISDTGLHVFIENQGWHTYSGGLYPVDPVDLVVGLEVVSPPVIVNNMVKFTKVEGSGYTIHFTDKPPCDYGCPDGYAGLFWFQAVLENKSNTLLADLTVKVHTLTNENLLVLARGSSLPDDFVGAETGGEGALWTLPASAYYDGRILYQGPSKVALPRFGICLKEIKRFDFYVDVLGKVQ